MVRRWRVGGMLTASSPGLSSAVTIRRISRRWSADSAWYAWSHQRTSAPARQPADHPTDLLVRVVGQSGVLAAVPQLC
jgi:hypothetical protein